ncbi:10012_t:CDS:2 [Ambispora gerdemannii]|uniref:10012_t:CDS:1 n=1 Tax=Ambispora gerdemannii TaxID=144530 RepID=A0A9N9AK62_9GLOM|nr:10012_t:CDS:2 [Ambispora gerdemannii]
MRAIAINKWLENVDEISVSDNVPEPELVKGQVLVQIKAIGLNFFEILEVQGKYQQKFPFPFIPGAEFSGVIIKIHPETKNRKLKIGDRVFGQARGTYAERVAVQATNLHPILDGMSFEDAAGLFITYPTSYAALVLRAQLKRNEWCLVHAGAGGVGIAAVQVAKALGAKVIATGGSIEKLAVASQNGADYVINYRDKDWTRQVKKITGDHGVDVVFDPVGLIEESMKCIAWNGRLVVIGFVSGKIEKISMNRVLLKNCAILGLFWGAHYEYAEETVPVVWDALLHLFRTGRLRPVVYPKVFDGLENVKEGLKALEGRQTFGKVVVRQNSSKTDNVVQSKI